MTLATASPNDREPLLLAVLGMDERQLKVLEMVVARHCRNDVHLVPEASAQACLLDMDSVRAADRLTELRRQAPGRPLLLLSIQPMADDLLGKDLYIAKPIAREALLASFAALKERLRPAAEPSPEVAAAVEPPVAVPVVVPTMAAAPHTPAPPAANDDNEERTLIGNADDIDLSSPEQYARIQYEPARYLQGLIASVAREAAERGQAALIRGPWPSITLMPTLGLARVACSDENLRIYGAQLDMASRAKVSYLPLPVGAQRQPDAVPLDALLWKLSLWAARGRLPARTALDVQVRLEGKPDFSRLVMTPGAPRIAVFWSSKPCSLAETPRILQLPQRCVFGFYSATKAIGLLIESAAQAVDSAPEADPAKYVPGSFARRFLARLRNSN